MGYYSDNEQKAIISNNLSYLIGVCKLSCVLISTFLCLSSY